MQAKYFNTIVIGGGPGGLMAAIFASQNGQKVAILEKNPSLGKKLLLTGGGRCNLTNVSSTKGEFIKKIGRGGRFLFSSLTDFGPKETMHFFEDAGAALKIEKDGRVFPKSDRAQTIREALTKILRDNRVEILVNQNVTGLKVKNNSIECVKIGGKNLYAKNFILTTGGKSFPATGSTGDFYPELKKLGHTIVMPAPALSPIRIKDAWVKNLQGISLETVSLKLIQEKKKINLGAGALILTHFGLSGPLIINSSKTIGEYLKRGAVILELDLFPDLNNHALEEKFKKDMGAYQKFNLKNYLAEQIPEKLAGEILKLIGLTLDTKINSLKKTDRLLLVKTLKNLRLQADSLLGFNMAMVTSGGVKTKEVDSKTMRSKIIPNLFLAGEILDLDGPTGGYNLQIAWTTGRAAGLGASQ